ncbi:MAG: hypothetical protein HWD59_01490 [Coxiellaceae bacterium]|nr:MAG: hypothetical protein HWD59_01490 [Coxiellaceae bacterium]
MGKTNRNRKEKFLEYLLDNFDDPNEPFADFAYSMAKRLGLGREIFITTNKNNNRNIVSTLLDSFFETVNSQSFLTAQENLLTLLKSEQQELTMKIIILITKNQRSGKLCWIFCYCLTSKKTTAQSFFEILFNLDFEAKHSLQRLKAAPIVKELLVTYIDKNFMFAIKLLVELQWTSHAPNLTTDLINLLNNQAYQSVHIDIIKGLGQLGADTHIRIEILQQINIAFENNQLSDYQYAMVLMQLIDHCDTLFENCSKNTRRNSNSSDFFLAHLHLPQSIW